MEKKEFLKDDKIILHMLLKHEEKLQQIESELERLRHEVYELESLKEKINGLAYMVKEEKFKDRAIRIWKRIFD